MLTQSKVIFNEEKHSYTLDGTTLSGVTPIIHKYLFPEMYSSVPEAVLNKARDKGKRVHHLVQMFVEGLLPKDELAVFANATRGINFIASEYLVSDNKHVASSIDIIDSSLNLYDIKTTAVLNTEYLQWQLSIYAYLFEKQNPTLRTGKFRAIHYTDESVRIVDITRLPDDYVIALLEAHASGAEQFDNPLHRIPDDLNALLQDYWQLASQLADIKAVEEPIEKRVAEIKLQMAALLNGMGVKSVSGSNAKVTVSADSTRETFDLKAFRKSEAYNMELEKFVKTSTQKGRVTITPQEPLD